MGMFNFNFIRFANKVSLFGGDYFVKVDGAFKFSSKMFDIMYKILEEDIKKFLHCVEVGDFAQQIAKSQGYDEKTLLYYYAAGLLHDFAKHFDYRFVTQDIFESFYKDIKYNEIPEYAYHAFFCPIVLGFVFDYDKEIMDREFINSLTFHCTGRGNMSMLEKTIYFADKVSYTKDEKEKGELLNLSLKDFDEAFKRVCQNNHKYLLEKTKNQNINYPDNRFTEEFINQYCL